MVAWARMTAEQMGEEPAPGSGLIVGDVEGKPEVTVHVVGVPEEIWKQSAGGRSPELFFWGTLKMP